MTKEKAEPRSKPIEGPVDSSFSSASKSRKKRKSFWEKLLGD
ncbi:MAG: hypothetical protein ACTSUF_09760 [Candidatus Heimdallarchaeaceae archaeon]